MKILLKSMAIGLCLIAQSQAMQRVRDEPTQEIQIYRDQIPAEVWSEIFTTASNHKDKILELGNDVSFDAVFGNLRRVCKSWQSIFDQRTNFNKDRNQFWINALISAYDTTGHGEICKLFLNGQLIYTPDEGKPIIQSFADLKTPFAGVFDLSKYGEAWKHLSICTGYRKEKNPDNANKVEIWFSPRFLIERTHEKGTVTQFKDIVDKGYWHDDAPVGIFWTPGWLDNLNMFDYLTTQSLVELFNDNLFKKYMSFNSRIYRPGLLLRHHRRLTQRTDQEKFHVVFCKPKSDLLTCIHS